MANERRTDESRQRRPRLVSRRYVTVWSSVVLAALLGLIAMPAVVDEGETTGERGMAGEGLFRPIRQEGSDNAIRSAWPTAFGGEPMAARCPKRGKGCTARRRTWFGRWKRCRRRSWASSICNGPVMP